MNIQSLPALLSANAYPGRGIVLGRSANGQASIAVYFIMGRSANSRNRIFVPTEDGIRTQARDPAAMSDPSLIIYHPVRLTGRTLVVTNGDQTDTIRDALLSGEAQTGMTAAGNAAEQRAALSACFEKALDTRTFEPDPPHYTPRISGILLPDGAFRLAILKTADGNPACRCCFHYAYDAPVPGEGRFLHTYQGDGTPLPSFEGEPIRIALDAADPETLADSLWDALHGENKVSLFVRYTDLASGAFQDAIRNRDT